MPKNKIGWGQAAVNNSNGFGAAASNNNIRWGYLHSRSYGHDETNLVGAGREVTLFTDAVIADGGTVESRSCVTAVFNELKAIDVIGYNETLAYQTAVEADGGTLESFSCTRNIFRNLIETNIK